jgi:uncharacterized membrane protein
MPDFTAGEAISSKTQGGMDFSTVPMPAIRKVLEVVGWGLVAILVITGLSAIFARTGFMISAFSEQIANPEEVFNAFDIRYYTNALATVLHLGPGFFVMVLGPLQFMRGVRKKHMKLHRISGRIFVLCGAIGAFSGIAIGVFDPFMGISDQGSI